MEIFFKILVVILLVLLNAFFVAAELALVRIRDTQLDTLVAKGHRRAKMARRIINHLDAYIGTTQLGITLASLGLGVVAEPVFHALLDPVFAWLKVDSPQVQRAVAIGVGFLVNTYLLVVVGELAPKALAIRKTLPTTLAIATPLEWFYRISYPFTWLLSHSAQWLMSQLGIEPASEQERAHSEEELRLLLSVSQKHSASTKLGRDIVLNAFDLRQLIARQVMRPRKEIVGLDTEASIAACLDVAEKTRYSRFPLCEGGDLDRMLGVVHIKDLYAMRLKARRGADLASAARKLIYVPETVRLETLLRLFLERRLHFAIVVDEYGGTVGMVTLENILEELVGQIQDEFDQEKPRAVKLGEETWEVAGTLPLHDLAELLGEDVRAEDVTTASGWVTHRLGGFPKVGDTVRVGPYQVRVDELDGVAVGRLRIKRIEPAELDGAPLIAAPGQTNGNSQTPSGPG
jgi:magnesium and cobalt exporter, CNNM family